MSGNILSWTVCVESSCFLTPVGGSLPLPVLLCFCSPSVSVVVSWHLYSSEGWGRAEKRGGAFNQLTSVMALQFSSSAVCWQSYLCLGHNVRGSVPGMKRRSLQHMSMLVMWRPSGYAAGQEKQVRLEPKFFGSLLEVWWAVNHRQAASCDLKYPLCSSVNNADDFLQILFYPVLDKVTFYENSKLQIFFLHL